jgi:hypothetical protein
MDGHVNLWTHGEWLFEGMDWFSKWIRYVQTMKLSHTISEFFVLDGRTWCVMSESLALDGRTWCVMSESFALDGRTWCVTSESFVLDGRTWCVTSEFFVSDGCCWVYRKQEKQWPRTTSRSHGHGHGHGKFIGMLTLTLTLVSFRQPQGRCLIRQLKLVTGYDTLSMTS